MALFDTGFSLDYPEIIINKPDFTASYPEQSVLGWGLSILASPVTVPYNKIRNLAQFIIKDLIYPASSETFIKTLDADRLELSRDKLRQLGGVNYTIETPDGFQIDAIFLSAQKFRDKVVEKGGQFKTKVDEDGKIISLIKIYNPELHKLFDDMSIDFSYRDCERAFLGKAISTITMYQLNNTPSTSKSIIDEVPGICIIGEGNKCLYEFNRCKIIQFLMNGSDIIAPNIRGTGQSSGCPSENGTYLDYESIYQFISTQLNYPDNKITAHGYCLSSGPLTQLASKHPIHLNIDRGFNKIGDVMSDAVIENMGFKLDNSLKSKILEYTLIPFVSTFSNYFIISYDNGSNIAKVKGSIFLLDATEDYVIPKKSSNNLRSRLDSSNILSAKVSFNGGHNDYWDLSTTILYQEFLAKRGTLLNFGNTPPLSSEDRMKYLSKLEKSTFKSYMASKCVIRSGNQKKASDKNSLASMGNFDVG